ncbi:MULTISPECIES: DUF5997 family protein [unclassified Curtobacterium]|jgi:hypothetical protein|uniref:DUF5997 family protein n=1 Tax=unclassified Curtobacterium TaxID=257496 RepID=UPI00052AD215|nr:MULTISPECIES: DUF5997 family protein [unclassified Curtobacterium]AIV40590.1 hypothetical protein NI26_11345 [Curtobacterium sp. MR_MD2014]MBP1302220.1 hypothetical protein [Curtobacterium sp. 1310]MCM3504356.1 DUF5997 family protein [Curtobacterium sp. ODYSSEY 48 V2]MCM3520267.1 DUF5997 family protein [Curtobacterium sp. P97]MDB6425557.1 DUF5997 family protein [Curtobacterium sp. 20TX0008]
MAQEQTMKPETAAKKLGILLAAAPESFRAEPVTRTAFDELRTQPPAWLEELRREGPHPRPVVAQKLGVSISGLVRAGVEEPLTTAEVKALLQEMPEWLVRERATQAEVHAENARVKQERADKAAARAQD